jgi:hypothetical protein
MLLRLLYCVFLVMKETFSMFIASCSNYPIVIGGSVILQSLIMLCTYSVLWVYVLWSFVYHLFVPPPPRQCTFWEFSDKLLLFCTVAHNCNWCHRLSSLVKKEFTSINVLGTWDKVKNAVFWDVAACGFIINWHFRGTCHLHVHCRRNNVSEEKC